MQLFSNSLPKFLFGFFLLLPLFALSQGQPILIDDSRNIEDVIKALQGPGTEITNITFSMPGQPKAMGYFEDTGGLLGLKKGLVITTGAALSAAGPNNNFGSSTSGSFTEMQDSDLATITAGRFFDIVIVEFDIKTQFSKLSFSYVFGSEEYPQFANSQFNDTFGLFISGPGILGSMNIATLDNGRPVSVNSIYQSNNFLSNGFGNTPDVNYYLQYNGVTQKLTAAARLIPKETYHVKIIISDVSDNAYDTGVFLEQESFIAEIPFDVTVSYEHDQFDYAIEGCNKAYLTVGREAADATDAVTLDLSFEGSAINGTDFTFVQPGPLTLGAGQLTSVTEIVPVADAVAEGNESVIAHIKNPVSGTAVTAQLTINDEMIYIINESTVCTATPTIINANPEADFSFNWELKNELSCQQCPSPIATLTQSALFKVEVTHLPSGCKANTTASVLVNNFQYHFSDETICFNVSSAINKNASNSYVYRWADSQGLSCLDCSSPLITGFQDVTLSVEVEDIASGCKTGSELKLNVFKFDFTFEETFACENKSTPINKNPQAGYSFTWEPHPFLSCTVCASPSVLLDHDASLTVKIKEPINGCEITKVVPVEVVEEYTVPDSFVCKGEESAINLNASDNYVYRWQANPAISCTTCKSPKVTLDQLTSFPLEIEEIKSGCKTQTQALVRVKTVDYVIPPITVCANEPTVINDNAPPQYLFQWEPAPVLSCLICPSPSITSDTDIQLNLYVQDNRVGCRTKLPVPVRVKKVEALFTYTITDQYSSIVVDFKNQSAEATEYLWSFGDGNNSSEFEVIHQYEPTGETINIQLTAISNQGLFCESTRSASIFIHEPIFIPNVFTPNGDQYNEFFEVKGLQKGLWTLTVVNRWGNLVYSSREYQNDWQAENVASGVYYYELRNPQDNKSYKGLLTVLK